MNSQTLAAEAADWKHSSSGTRWERFRDSGLLDSGLNFADSPFQRWPLQITALLVVSVIAAASLLMGPLHHPSRIVTALGEQRSVALADGSQLELDSDSDARIAFTAGERRVILARGEARVTVAKDAERPFFVSTPQVTVKTLGTVFKVRTVKKQTDVTVLQGRVAILAPLIDPVPGAQPLAPTLMSEGDRATINRAGEIQVEREASVLARKS
jgi:transmembrane sensor